jgi:basic membrane lipoprotein Med (substrate-binding protein (PBP1-ABC) superfamily)
LLRDDGIPGVGPCAVVVPPRTTTTEAGLRAAVASRLEGERPVVLVLDQLEKVLDDEDADGIMSWLAHDLRPDGPLRVLAALRADRYDRPLQHRAFADLFGQGVVNLVPMTPAELEEAVRAPAARVGRDVEPALLAELIGDTVAQPAVLPLLQFALTDLFDHTTGPTLTLATYRELGGVRAALARRADGLREALGPDREQVLARVLLRLTDVDDTGRAHRRVVRVEEVASVSPDAVAVATVLGRLNDLRLVTYDRDAAGGGTIELSHDALLREWPWFRDLIDRHRTNLRRHRAFVSALEAWESTGRNPAYLITGARLDEVRSWEADGALALTPDERAFLDAGLHVTAQRAEREAEQEQHRRMLERRSRRRLLLLATTAVGLVLALTSAVVLAGTEPPHVALVLHDAGDVEMAIERGVDEIARETTMTREKVLVDRAATPDLLRLTEHDRVDLVVSAALDVDHDTVARERAGTHFVLVERDATGPNVTLLAFADQEAAFLAGAAAALTTRTGRVAFIGGVDFSVLRRFEAGFVAGARAADPRVVVDVRYLTTAPDYEGFLDPVLSNTATRQAIADGADVVYLPAGAAQSGGLRAVVELAEATDHRLWAIGADEDAFHDRRWQTTPRARDHVLASTIKRFDLATRRALEDYLGPGLEPGRRVSDLANGELALAMTGGHLDDVAPRIEELRRAVVAGELVVPCVPAGLSPSAAAAAASGVKCPEA